MTIIVGILIALVCASPFSGWDKQKNTHQIVFGNKIYQDGVYLDTLQIRINVISLADGTLNGFLKTNYNINERSRELDTLNWRDLPHFDQNPFTEGDRLGFFDPSNQIYFTAPIDSFQIDGCHELKYSVDLQAICNIPINQFWSKSAKFPCFIVWFPVDSLSWEISKYHPDKFSGVKHLEYNDANLRHGQWLYWLNDTLRNRGQETVYGIYNWDPESLLPGDDKCNNIFLHLRAPFASDSTAGYHDLIIRREGWKHKLRMIRTTRSPLKRDTYDEVVYNGGRYGRNNISLIGVVDLEFDGIYELVVRESQSDLGDTHGYSQIYILKFKDGKFFRVGKSWSHSSC